MAWPEGNEVFEGQERQAGETIGDMRVEITNRKGEKISKLPAAGHMTANKKLLVELKVIWHCKYRELFHRIIFIYAHNKLMSN